MVKKWHKPKLIVLVRGKPEESVLDFCKGISATGEPNTLGVADGWYSGCKGVLLTWPGTNCSGTTCSFDTYNGCPNYENGEPLPGQYPDMAHMGVNEGCKSDGLLYEPPCWGDPPGEAECPNPLDPYGPLVRCGCGEQPIQCTCGCCYAIAES